MLSRRGGLMGTYSLYHCKNDGLVPPIRASVVKQSWELKRDGRKYGCMNHSFRCDQSIPSLTIANASPLARRRRHADWCRQSRPQTETKSSHRQIGSNRYFSRRSPIWKKPASIFYPSPKRDAAQECRSYEMHVNQPQTPTHQQVFFQKVQNLSVVGLDRRWKRLEQRKDGFSVFQ